MAGGRGKLTGKDGKQFSSEYQPATNGRKPSFKNEYSKMLGEQGGVIWIDAERVLERTNQAGKKEYGLQLNRIETLLAKLDRFATGKNEKLSFDVIRFLWEQFDGKPTQPIEAKVDVARVNERTDEELLAELQRLERGK